MGRRRRGGGGGEKEEDKEEEADWKFMGHVRTFHKTDLTLISTLSFKIGISPN